MADVVAWSQQMGPEHRVVFTGCSLGQFSSQVCDCALFCIGDEVVGMNLVQ